MRVGTYVLLETARARGVRYLQVSTDEVYGSIEEGSFTEESPLAPSSPYSATKAGADLLVSSYHHTFGVETLICRGSNNYGPYQYPEKLIPLMVLNALHGDKLPVYGDGMNVRNWLYVEDFARGIGHVLEHGVPGEAYNVGGPDECPNIEVVKGILEYTGAGDELIEYVTDRPGHDRRYSLGSEKVRALGWEAQVRFSDGLRAHGRLVPRQRVVVGADPLGRLPRVLRAPVRAGARVERRCRRHRRGAEESSQPVTNSLIRQPGPSLTRLIVRSTSFLPRSAFTRAVACAAAMRTDSTVRPKESVSFRAPSTACSHVPPRLAYVAMSGLASSSRQI